MMRKVSKLPKVERRGSTAFEKTINGARFYFVGGSRVKGEANSLADKLRGEGYRVRVVRETRPEMGYKAHVVYARWNESKAK